MINISGVQAEIDRAKADTPLPPGGSFAPITLQGGTYQPGSGTTMIQYQAACSWWTFWADAISSGNTAAQKEASQMADQIRTWLVYTSSAESFRAHWDAFIAQAKLGDPTGLTQEVELNCS